MKRRNFFGIILSLPFLKFLKLNKVNQKEHIVPFMINPRRIDTLDLSTFQCYTNNNIAFYDYDGNKLQVFKTF
jgi:hypothetical protein